MGPVNYPNNSSDQRLPASSSSEQSVAQNIFIGGSDYTDNMTPAFPTQTYSLYDPSSFTCQDRHINHPNQIVQNITYNNQANLALGQPHSSPSFQTGNTSITQPNINTFEDWSRDEFLSEEEIRMKSHEILENEDMQDLLRVFSMGGNNSVNNNNNMSEDGFENYCVKTSKEMDFLVFLRYKWFRAGRRSINLFMNSKT